MRRTVALCAAALAACLSAAGAVFREVPATTNAPAHVELLNEATSVKVFIGAGGMVETRGSCPDLSALLPLAPTNECVAWRCVRGRRGERSLWIGSAKGGGRSVGLTLGKDASPLQVEELAPGGAAPLVREAYRLRQIGATNQNFLAKSSKALRMAAKAEPLDVWNAIERAFLEDDGEDAAAKAALYGRDPLPGLLAAVDGYAGLGAWSEVRELAKQSVALAAKDPRFAHPRLERLAKMDADRSPAASR